MLSLPGEPCVSAPTAPLENGDGLEQQVDQQRKGHRPAVASRPTFHLFSEIRSAVPNAFERLRTF
jgi:hypothetical protein